MVTANKMIANDTTHSLQKQQKTVKKKPTLLTPLNLRNTPLKLLNMPPKLNRLPRRINILPAQDPPIARRGRHIQPGRKRPLTRPGEHDNPHLRVRRQPPEDGAQLQPHGLVEGIKLLGAVDLDVRDEGGGGGQEEVLVGCVAGEGGGGGHFGGCCWGLLLVVVCG